MNWKYVWWNPFAWVVLTFILFGKIMITVITPIIVSLKLMFDEYKHISYKDELQCMLRELWEEWL